MTERKFHKLVKRYLAGNSTEEEKIFIDAWLKEYVSDDRYSQPPERKKQEIHEHAMRPVKKDIPHKKIMFMHVLRISAIIVLLIITSILIWRNQAVEMINVSTASVAQKVLLPDGSIVWLQPQSALVYPKKFKGDTRAVSFSGEGLFEVDKDPAHPFIINYGEVSAKVLGTSFQLSAIDSGYLRISVLTGKVILSSIKDERGVAITPDTYVIYNGKEVIMQSEVTEMERKEIAAGTEYNMHFEGMPISEIIQKIERKFNVKVELEDNKLSSCMITTDVTDQSLKETLRTLAEILDFEVRIEGKSVRLLGGSCK